MHLTGVAVVYAFGVTVKFARLPHWTALAVAASALALSTVGATAAQAGVPARIAPSTLHLNPSPVLHYYAPTANLTAAANAITFNSKSVTTDIQVPAGLNLTHAVTIRASYGASHQTAIVHAVSRGYDNLAGVHLVWNYAAPSSASFRAQIRLTLTETVSPTDTETFTVNWNPILTPLYDVNISPLTFTLTSIRTFESDNVTVYWFSPHGLYGAPAVEAPLGKQQVIPNFAESFHEVSAQTPRRPNDLSPLTVPTVGYIPTLYWNGQGTDGSAPLVTGHGYRFDRTIHVSDLLDDWRGRLTYTVTQSLHTYPSL